jgi:pimeloyl-ACP methyl ester carboxylesterase
MPHTRSSDGTRLHYEVLGSGRTDLLFLHGMGTSDTWRPLLGCLDFDQVRAVTCDWRGHGRSDGGPERFTYPQLNADVLAIADAAAMDSGVIVGFSGSCKNAVWLAAEQPPRVRGLVLVAPPGLEVVPLPRDRIAYFFHHLEQKKNIPPEFESWFSEKIGAEKAPVVQSLVATARAVLDASAEMWLYSSVADRAPRVIQPVSVVAAGRDMMYGPEFQRQTTLASLPHATMDVLDCGHFIPCEEPALLARLIENFCGALPRA